MSTKRNVSVGIGAGHVLAFGFSAIVNKSVGWAILHMFCGWFYVIWAVAIHGETLSAALGRLSGG
jgi:hypothetical protein